MTTTVTVKTHDWPVAVEASYSHNHANDQVVSHGYGSTTTFVPSNSEQSFNVTDTQSVTVRELPKDATGLFQPDAREDGGYAQTVKSDIAEAGLGNATGDAI